MKKIIYIIIIAINVGLHLQVDSVDLDAELSNSYSGKRWNEIDKSWSSKGYNYFYRRRYYEDCVNSYRDEGYSKKKSRSFL